MKVGIEVGVNREDEILFTLQLFIFHYFTFKNYNMLNKWFPDLPIFENTEYTIASCDLLVKVALREI